MPARNWRFDASANMKRDPIAEYARKCRSYCISTLAQPARHRTKRPKTLAAGASRFGDREIEKVAPPKIGAISGTAPLLNRGSDHRK